MDTRNYCIECDRPKPCLCDLDKHKWDTKDFIVLTPLRKRYEDKQC